MSRPQATPSQLFALVFSCDGLGAWRLGSPVRCVEQDGPIPQGLYRAPPEYHEVGTLGVVVHPNHWGPADDRSYFLVCIRDFEDVDFEDSGHIESVTQAKWGVDLTDATGRAHLVLAIIDAVCDVMKRTHRNWPFCSMSRAWIPGQNVNWWAVGSVPTEWRRICAHLNLNDDTRLPDGSRWVDAEALRLVGLHVLGGAA